MRLLTREQSQEVDLAAVRDFCIPSESLIAEAAHFVTENLRKHISGKTAKILVLVGPGNNGADGWTIATELRNLGFVNVQVWIVLVGRSDLLSKKEVEARSAGVQVSAVALDQIASFPFIVDAIFGTGLNRDIPDELRSLFLFVNKCSAKVFAVDIPSGLDANRGRTLGACLRADFCFSMGLPKPGFFIEEGPAHVGHLVNSRLSFPPALLDRKATDHFAFGINAAKMLLPRRKAISNKSNAGKVQMVAGSLKYPGAAVLSSMAAARMGAGYVSLASFDDLRSLVSQIPEIIFNSEPEIDAKSAFVIGPGLGQGPGVHEKLSDLLFKLRKNAISRVLIDADGLRYLSEAGRPLPSTWLLTPHTGELAKLLSSLQGKDISASEIESDRFGWAFRASRELGCIVLLKGFRSIVCDGKRATVILSGNAALAKGGAGDVLTGFIGALMAQGLEPYLAACLGAYVHGRLADEWLRDAKSQLSLSPSDLYRLLPGLLGSL